MFFLETLLSPGKVKNNMLLALLLRLNNCAMAKIVWLCWLLYDKGVSLSSPTPRYCDSKSFVQITHMFVFHERTKHIETVTSFSRSLLGYHSFSLCSFLFGAGKTCLPIVLVLETS